MDHLFKDSFFLHDKWMAVGKEEKISHSLHFCALHGDNSMAMTSKERLLTALRGGSPIGCPNRTCSSGRWPGTQSLRIGPTRHGCLSTATTACSPTVASWMSTGGSATSGPTASMRSSTTSTPTGRRAFRPPSTRAVRKRLILRQTVATIRYVAKYRSMICESFWRSLKRCRMKTASAP